MENYGLVSVIMPAYNAEKWVAEAIESVLRQTYPYFELIVVDDGSSDGTGGVIESFKDERVVYIHHSKNLGVAEARNTALKAARGKWGTLIDADDVWLPERLEKLLEILESAGESYFVADDHIVYFDSPRGLKKWGSEFDLYYHIKFGKEILNFTFSDYIKNNSPLIHPIFPLKIVTENRIFYKQEFVPVEDFEFYCELFRMGLNLKLTRSAYYLYRLTPGSLTAKEPKDSQIKAIKYVLSLGKFNGEERFLLAKLLDKVEKDYMYNTFTYYLKSKEFHRAIGYGFKNPLLFAEFIFMLPCSMRYRLKAKLSGGRIK